MIVCGSQLSVRVRYEYVLLATYVVIVVGPNVRCCSTLWPWSCRWHLRTKIADAVLVSCACGAQYFTSLVRASRDSRYESLEYRICERICAYLRLSLPTWLIQRRRLELAVMKSRTTQHVVGPDAAEPCLHAHPTPTIWTGCMVQRPST